ncbi:MAG: Glu-tRNA(Gln) amidotransferase subunit GatE [Thermoplasmatota archaeon]
MHDVDFEALGFKCGLEIHQQLDTERKLFCRCPPVYRNDPAHFEIKRHMRPTLSEMGTYDGTALMEFKTKKNITYQFFRDTTCSYEIDDTPPFEMDEKALEISMVIARAMNCALVDEVHVSRKQYLDGSIPTGFQRTAIISLGGHVPWVGQDREIEIRQISLEEDACREMSDVGHEMVMRTDRLSIPLVEVVTEPNAKNPAEAGEMAEILGWVMRSTDLVRRGSGATRQDVNVSVEGGRRVEIKGVPKISFIPRVTAGEAVRQHNLLNIKTELESRGLDPDSMDADDFSTMVFKDITDHFTGRKVELFYPWFRGEVDTEGGIDIKAVLVPGFRSIYSHPTHGDHTFADEVGGRLRVIACLDRMPNLFTSDQEPALGITSKDLQHVRKELGAGKDDAFVIVWGPREDTLTGVKEIYIRAKEAFFGVPHETRQVLNPDMTTFERILPGPDRMYPDTDRPPIVVTKDILDNVNSLTPVPWWEQRDEMVKAGVPEPVAHKLIVSDILPIYREAVDAGAPPREAGIFLYEGMRALGRSGVDTGSIGRPDLIEVLSLLGKGLITSKAVSKVITGMAASGSKPKKIIETLDIGVLPEKKVGEIAGKSIEDNPELVSMFRDGRHGPLMGMVMSQIGPRFDGSKVWKKISSLVDQSKKI